MLNRSTTIGELLAMAESVGPLQGICIYSTGMIRIFTEGRSMSHQLEPPAAATTNHPEESNEKPQDPAPAPTAGERTA